MLASKKLLIGILGVVFAFFFSIHQMLSIDISVLFVYTGAVYFIPFAFALTCCSVPFADAFCEDMEYHYTETSVLRGGLGKYVISKVTVIGLTAMITMILGTAIFVLLIRLQVPWIDVSNPGYLEVLENGSLKPILHARLYFTYFILYAFRLGLLAAVLAVLASYISMFWTNRLMVYSIPFLAYYLQNYYGGKIFQGIPKADISVIFNSYYNVWENELLSFIWPLLISFILILIIGYGIYLRMKRRLKGE